MNEEKKYCKVQVSIRMIKSQSGKERNKLIKYGRKIGIVVEKRAALCNFQTQN